MDSAHRRNPLPFDLMPAGWRRSAFGARVAPAAFFRAQFAPLSPPGLVVPPRGAKSSLNSRAPVGRRWAPNAFSRARFAPPLPARPCSSVWGSKFFTQFPRPRSVPTAFSRAQFAPPSPLSLVVPFRGANSSLNSRAPAGRRSLPAAFFRARFAPPSPPGLVVPFRGAKSSHNSRATAGCRPPFPGRGLLPPPR